MTLVHKPNILKSFYKTKDPIAIPQIVLAL